MYAHSQEKNPTSSFLLPDLTVMNERSIIETIIIIIIIYRSIGHNVKSKMPALCVFWKMRLGTDFLSKTFELIG